MPANSTALGSIPPDFQTINSCNIWKSQTNGHQPCKNPLHITQAPAASQFRGTDMTGGGMHRTHWIRCTSINHLRVHVHVLIYRCWLCYSEEDWKLWCLDHFIAELFNIIKVCIFLSYRMGSNTLATLTTEAGEALIFLFWCERSGLKDSKSKSEFVPVLSSIGLEALYPLRHQEPSTYLNAVCMQLPEPLKG